MYLITVSKRHRVDGVIGEKKVKLQSAINTLSSRTGFTSKLGSIIKQKGGIIQLASQT